MAIVLTVYFAVASKINKYRGIYEWISNKEELLNGFLMSKKQVVDKASVVLFIFFVKLSINSSIFMIAIDSF